MTPVCMLLTLILLVLAYPMIMIPSLVTIVSVVPALRVSSGIRYMACRLLLCDWRQFWTVSRFVNLFRELVPGRMSIWLQLAILVSYFLILVTTRWAFLDLLTGVKGRNLVNRG